MRHLLAVQAQDAASVPYALRARGGELRDGLLVTWLMRSTLHLVDADDLAWLHPLFAPRMVTANERRLRQLGVTEDHTDALVAALPATRAELAAQFDLPGQALPHALHRAAIAGRLAMTPGGPRPPRRAPGADSAPALAPRVFVPLQLAPAPDRDASLDELARRYYACHAGADQRDLAYWSGLPLRDCRPPDEHRVDDGPVPDVLIPAFDELLLGWRDRTPTVPPEHAKRVHPGGGILRAVALEDGVAVGTWSRAGGRSASNVFERVLLLALGQLRLRRAAGSGASSSAALLVGDTATRGAERGEDRGDQARVRAQALELALDLGPDLVLDQVLRRLGRGFQFRRARSRGRRRPGPSSASGTSPRRRACPCR